MTACKANTCKNGITNTKDIPPSTHSHRGSTSIEASLVIYFLRALSWRLLGNKADAHHIQNQRVTLCLKLLTVYGEM